MVHQEHTQSAPVSSLSCCDLSPSATLPLLSSEQMTPSSHLYSFLNSEDLNDVSTL